MAIDLEIRTTISDSGKRTSAVRVLAAGMVGHFVEFYDFAVYGLTVLVLSKHYFPKTDPGAAVLAAFAIYGLAFVVRPLGGICFGYLGDKIGRKAVLAITLTAIGGATAAIGLLPTYENLGITATILLVLCRLVQGFSAGGEAVGAPTFVVEHAPVNRRAFWVNIVTAMSAVPSIVAGVLIYFVSASMSDAEFSAWGWRIAFLLAAPISLIGLYIRNRTDESETFKRVKSTETVVSRREATFFDPDNYRKIVQVFFVVSLNALTFYFLVGYFVTYLQMTASLSRAESLISNAIGMLAISILLPCGGFLADIVGRKPMMLMGAIFLAAVSIPSFYVLSMGTMMSATCAQVMLAAGLAIYGGGSYAFYVELFPTATRFRSAAISYNVSYALFGGTAPFVGTYLVKATGSAITPAYYLTVLAIIVFFVVLTVPETKGVDLDAGGRQKVKK